MKTKADLIALLTRDTAESESEEHYLQCGPGKHGQDNMTGVQYVAMNLELLEGFLEDHEEHENYYDIWSELPAAERREVWEKSSFHWGIMGYDEDDADFWWSKQS